MPEARSWSHTHPVQQTGQDLAVVFVGWRVWVGRLPVTNFRLLTREPAEEHTPLISCQSGDILI